MVRMAATAEPHSRWGVRCGFARHADVTGIGKSFCFFSTKGTHSLCDRSDQRRLALGPGVSPTRKAKRMDLRAAKYVSAFAFLSLHVSPRRRDYSRFVSNVFRVC